MCGICGEVRSSGGVSLVEPSKATQSMRSRGPDAEGFFAQGSRAFGHRRLSILDLAPSSQQPMMDNELGLGVVFNGCIYNFRELGADCVCKFKGMFVFAIWERDSGRVVIARDRLGIKPLYYTEGTGFFRFASTLPALLAAGGGGGGGGRG